jgi:hypothetical protein
LRDPGVPVVPGAAASGGPTIFAPPAAHPQIMSSAATATTADGTRFAWVNGLLSAEEFVFTIFSPASTFNALWRGTMSYTHRANLIAIGLVLLCGTPAAAQSAQAVSLQVSGLAGAITFRDTLQFGAGAEAQIRLNRVLASDGGVLSVGFGAQYTHHSFAAGQRFDVSGVFIEPRYAFALSSERFFPYVSARFAALRQSSNVVDASYGYAAGAGVGIGYALGRNVNLDVGAAMLVQQFAHTTITTTGQPYSFGTMPGYALKIGLSLGL